MRNPTWASVQNVNRRAVVLVPADRRAFQDEPRSSVTIGKRLAPASVIHSLDKSYERVWSAKRSARGVASPSRTSSSTSPMLKPNAASALAEQPAGPPAATAGGGGMAREFGLDKLDPGASLLAARSLGRLASESKCLAQNNKSGTEGAATKRQSTRSESKG